SLLLRSGDQIPKRWIGLLLCVHDSWRTLRLFRWLGDDSGVQRGYSPGGEGMQPVPGLRTRWEALTLVAATSRSSERQRP
ncbi:hypothetical protein AVEN_13339-1, partial [Araneus ventricosus]